MKTSYKCPSRALRLLLPCCFTIALLNVCSAAPSPSPADDKPAASAGSMVPLDIKLPAPAFKGTPKDIQLSSYVEPLSDKPPPAMMVPVGLKNLAAGKKLTSSDKNATSENLERITDRDKDASDQRIIFLRKGTQY